MTTPDAQTVNVSFQHYTVLFNEQLIYCKLTYKLKKIKLQLIKCDLNDFIFNFLFLRK